MTLILTLANASGICQSSDYQLTDRDTGAPVSDRAGCKQLQAGFEGLDLRLAFTGIAEVGAGLARQRTVDWLSGELKALPHDSGVQDICEALTRRSVAITGPYGSRGVLEIILTVAAVGEPFRVAVISNADWSKRPPEANPQFTIAIHTIAKSLHLISGYRDSVPATQRHRLRALAREIGNSATEVLDALAEINAIAAKNSGGCVSEDCWVTSQFADGRVRRSASRNIGQHPGDIHSLLGSFDLSEFIRKNFRAAPGQEIRLVQSAGATAGPGDGTPLPPPTGEPRRFTLSGSSVTGLLRSPAGDQCGSIDISQCECVLEMRCNEEVMVPFATVALSGVGPIGRAFPKPLLPWPLLGPALMIDDTAVPRGWEYSVGYWLEEEAHRVIIPQSSRGIRNLAFLGPSEEMVIVAPSTTMEFAWGECEHAPSATVHARVSWRSRLDGTRG
jgi:hypothetical protein